MGIAAIELETSLASTAAALLTDTATLFCGRAAATISTARASAKIAIGTCLRQPGRLGATESARAGLTNADAAARRLR